MQVTFDLDNPFDRARVRKLIDDVESVSNGGATEKAQIALAKPADLERRVRELLEGKHYGRTRRTLARLVAAASPRAVSRDGIYEAMAAIRSDRNQSLAVGGAHSSLERSWKRLGGDGKFFETTSNGFTMRREVAAVVLKVLDEWTALHPDDDDDESDESDE